MPFDINEIKRSQKINYYHNSLYYKLFGQIENELEEYKTASRKFTFKIIGVGVITLLCVICMPYVLSSALVYLGVNFFIESCISFCINVACSYVLSSKISNLLIEECSDLIEREEEIKKRIAEKDKFFSAYNDRLNKLDNVEDESEKILLTEAIYSILSAIYAGGSRLDYSEIKNILGDDIEKCIEGHYIQNLKDYFPDHHKVGIDNQYNTKTLHKLTFMPQSGYSILEPAGSIRTKHPECVQLAIFLGIIKLSSQEIDSKIQLFKKISEKHLKDEHTFDKNWQSLGWFYIIPDQSEDEWLEILSLTDRLTESVKKAFFTLELLESKKAPESIKHLIENDFFDKEQQVRLDLIKQMQEEIAKRPVEEVVSQQDVILSEAVEQEDEQKTIFEEIKLIDTIKIPLIRPVAVEAYSIKYIV